MTYAVGSPVVEGDMINQYTTKCRNTVTALMVWYQGNVYNGVFPADQLSTKDPGGPAAGEIKAKDTTPVQYEITASYIAEAFAGWSKKYTAYRRCKYVQYLNVNGSYVNNDNQTAMAALIPAYVQTGVYANIDASTGRTGLITGTKITITQFNAYLADLYQTWNIAKENVAVVNGYYCHSSCHSNCHWSRGGR